MLCLGVCLVADAHCPSTVDKESILCARDETEQICFDWIESGLISLFGSQTLTACLMRFIMGLLSVCSVSHTAIWSLILESHPAKSSGANKLISYREPRFMSQLCSKFPVFNDRCKSACASDLTRISPRSVARGSVFVCIQCSTMSSCPDV